MAGARKTEGPRWEDYNRDKNIQGTDRHQENTWSIQYIVKMGQRGNSVCSGTLWLQTGACKTCTASGLNMAFYTCRPEASHLLNLWIFWIFKVQTCIKTTFGQSNMGQGGSVYSGTLWLQTGATERASSFSAAFNTWSFTSFEFPKTCFFGICTRLGFSRNKKLQYELINETLNNSERKSFMPGHF